MGQEYWPSCPTPARHRVDAPRREAGLEDQRHHPPPSTHSRAEVSVQAKGALPRGRQVMVKKKSSVGLHEMAGEFHAQECCWKQWGSWWREVQRVLVISWLFINKQRTEQWKVSRENQGKETTKSPPGITVRLERQEGCALRSADGPHGKVGVRASLPWRASGPPPATLDEQLAALNQGQLWEARL